ncbi:hypothetical protein LUZ60_003156 [Juncus effusus]|nr:hypothetical protein LUZ60_003156 [Juncus effusus]
MVMVLKDGLTTPAEWLEKGETIFLRRVGCRTEKEDSSAPKMKIVEGYLEENGSDLLSEEGRSAIRASLTDTPLSPPPPEPLIGVPFSLFCEYTIHNGDISYKKKKNKRMSSEILHTGGCHCKKVRWQVSAPSNIIVWKCNCTNCAMRGNVHFIVPSSKFKLTGDSSDFITTYTFGSHTAKHTFCKVCGITSFYTPRSNPDGIAVTVNCVDLGTICDVEIRSFDGINWEKSFAESSISAFSKEG